MREPPVQYRLGLALPEALSYHQYAWLVDAEYSSEFAERLCDVERCLGEMGQLQLATQTREVIALSCTEFLSPDHLGWAAAYDVLKDQPGLSLQQRPTVSEFIANLIRAVSHLAGRDSDTLGDPLLATVESVLREAAGREQGIEWGAG